MYPLGGAGAAGDAEFTGLNAICFDVLCFLLNIAFAFACLGEVGVWSLDLELLQWLITIENQ
jgi:hypothetical protein